MSKKLLSKCKIFKTKRFILNNKVNKIRDESMTDHLFSVGYGGSWESFLLPFCHERYGDRRYERKMVRDKYLLKEFIWINISWTGLN